MEQVKIVSGTKRLETLLHTPSSKVEVGDVVEVNGRVLVAYETVEASEEGAFIHKCEECEAESGVTDADAAGKAAYWDSSTNQVTTTSTDNTKCGMFLGPIVSGEDATFQLDNSVTV